MVKFFSKIWPFSSSIWAAEAPPPPTGLLLGAAGARAAKNEKVMILHSKHGKVYCPGDQLVRQDALVKNITYQDTNLAYCSFENKPKGMAKVTSIQLY